MSESNEIVNNMKKTFTDIIDEIVKFNKDKFSNSGDELIKDICNQVIKRVSNKYNGYKIVCCGYLVQKGKANFFFDSNCLWQENNDFAVTNTNYEFKDFYCFISLFCVSP